MKGEFVNCHLDGRLSSSSLSRSRCGVAITSRLCIPWRVGCRSGFDIEGASRPVVVPVPQTGIAGTLNLCEELFPERKQKRYETERQGETGGSRNRERAQKDEAVAEE